MMQLVEKHTISKTDARFELIDRAAFASKNLYNAALYEIRQYFIFCGKYLNYNQMDKLMQKHEAYRALPRKAFTGRLFEKRASQETDQSAKMKDRKKTSSKGERSCLNWPHYPNGKKRCQAICRT